MRLGTQLFDAELLTGALEMLEKEAFIPPGDPAAAAGGAPPGGGMPPGGAPPGAPPGGDPAMMGAPPGGAPPGGAPPGGAPMQPAPPTVMDPSGMGGMGGMAPQQQAPEKKKFDPLQLYAQNFQLTQLVLGLYRHFQIAIPEKAVMGEPPDPATQQMAQQEFQQRDMATEQAMQGIPGGPPPPSAAGGGMPPGGGGMPPGGDPAAMGGMPPGAVKMGGEVILQNKTRDEGIPAIKLGEAVPGGRGIGLLDNVANPDLEAAILDKAAGLAPRDTGENAEVDERDFAEWLQRTVNA